MEYNPKIIGSQIQKYRKEKHISQKELGELVNLSGSYIGNLESGGRSANSSVSMKNICKISEVLGISLEDIASTNLKWKYSEQNETIYNEIVREIDSLCFDDLQILHNILLNFLDICQ